MSFIPYTTQAGPLCTPEGSQPSSVIFIIYPRNITANQTRLMKDCQDYLHSELETSVKDYSEIRDIPSNAKFFVIPSIRDELVSQLRKLVIQHTPCIYTPRAIIEARVRRKIKLPTRSIAVSLSMIHCHVFLTKACNRDRDLMTKINEMCGTVVSSFKDPNLNVVITDRADDRYCIRARQQSLNCVSKSWVIDNHRDSLREDENFFDTNSLQTANKHHVKPFFGLKFKLSTKYSETLIKNIISENQGKVIFGEVNDITHEVIDEFIPSNYEDIGDKPREKTQRTQIPHVGPKKVDTLFIEACAELGYYLTLDEYREFRDGGADKRATIKQEPICLLSEMSETSSMSASHRPSDSLGSDDCFTPPVLPPRPSTFATPQLVNNSTRSQRSQSNENQSMLPPPTIPRQTRLQHQQQSQQQYNNSDSMNDVILKALSGFENGVAQTQLASTQMRGLPERAIQIEQTMEPSQQLYWSDTVSRRD